MKIYNEQSYGTLPEPFSIPQILALKPQSTAVIKIFDTKPNLVALLDSKDAKIVLKRFGWRSKFHFFISPFMHSRARMSWEIAKVLEFYKLTPIPLFVHTKKKFGFKYENFFITEAIFPNKTFRKFILEEKDINNIKIVIKNLAYNIAKIHAAGIYHRDLTTGNFLVDRFLNIFVVDLNRARNVNKLSLKQRLKDISKVHFPKKAVLSQELLIEQFVNHYKEQSNIDIDWKSKYWKLRNKLIKRRRRSKQLKQFFRLNN